ncbi:MAG TPA: efflux RND transporter periplasmic adaptor subunit [Kiritimatiellia bacterium]|nr:efflux RND transporter periplasmic adaptor subunit [Kiritimatiellia bacterium]HMO98188.1 efflux RND transporter periplasmic adaptor subunit [Kiritimatiellia bacterium]HMP97475.1 efflux RND transporter periplasmic adaptor subunit [Kiritimatiellia bacterium]
MKRFRSVPISSVVLWSLIVVMTLLIIFSIFVRRSEPVVEEPAERAYPVRLLTLTARDLPDVVSLPGRVEPMVRARLPVDKPGRVVERLAQRGDTVTNGQVLLRLDARLWEAMLAAAEIELREAEKEYRRWIDLEAAGAVSGSDMDMIRTRLERARVAHTEASTHVSQCEVRSPADGRINDHYVEVGEHATEGMAVFELVVTDPVKVRLDVPERDAPALAEKQTLTFTASVLPGREFTGTVSFAASATRPGHATFAMEAIVENPDEHLMPGMIIEARFQRGMMNGALAVPLEAVIPRRGEHMVFIARDGRAVRRLVRIDRISGEEAVLSDGLQAGDHVVVSGNRTLIDGALLAPLESP